MSKDFPGQLMSKFDPALSDRGGAFVGMGDVGMNTISFTANVNTAGNHVLVHSLKVAPSFWAMRATAHSLGFTASEGVTAMNSSAIYYTASYAFTSANAIAVSAKAYIWR